MGWVALLEAVHALHWIGMGVSRALAHHAHTGVGASQALAATWLMLRARYGDPAEAMRALWPLARTRGDRRLLEALLDCLETPGADHGATLVGRPRGAGGREAPSDRAEVVADLP